MQYSAYNNRHYNTYVLKRNEKKTSNHTVSLQVDVEPDCKQHGGLGWRAVTCCCSLVCRRLLAPLCPSERCAGTKSQPRVAAPPDLSRLLPV